MNYILNISLVIGILTWGGLTQSQAQESKRTDRTGRSIKIQSNSTVKKRRRPSKKKGKASERGSVKIRGNRRVKENQTRGVKHTRGKAVTIHRNTAKNHLNMDAHEHSKKHDRGAIKIVGNPTVDDSVGKQLNRQEGQNAKDIRPKDKKRARSKDKRKKTRKKR